MNFQSVHPVFHVAMLQPEKPSTIPNHVQLPPPPVIVNGELEYEISKILNLKVVNFCTWYGVLVTKGLMKRLHGFSPQNSLMHQNWFQTSMLQIWINLDPTLDPIDSTFNL